MFLFSLADSIAYWSRLSPAAVFFSLVIHRIHLFCCLFILLPSNAVHKNNKALFLKQTKNLFYHFSLKYTHITAISVGQKNIRNYNKGRQNQQSAIAYVTRSNWFAFGWLFLFFFPIIAFQQTVYQCFYKEFFCFVLFCRFQTLLYPNDFLQKKTKVIVCISRMTLLFCSLLQFLYSAMIWQCWPELSWYLWIWNISEQMLYHVHAQCIIFYQNYIPGERLPVEAVLNKLDPAWEDF